MSLFFAMEMVVSSGIESRSAVISFIVSPMDGSENTIVDASRRSFRSSIFNSLPSFRDTRPSGVAARPPIMTTCETVTRALTQIHRLYSGDGNE
jgi:hypothetical protein